MAAWFDVCLCSLLKSDSAGHGGQKMPITAITVFSVLSSLTVAAVRA